MVTWNLVTFNLKLGSVLTSLGNIIFGTQPDVDTNLEICAMYLSAHNIIMH